MKTDGATHILILASNASIGRNMALSTCACGRGGQVEVVVVAVIVVVDDGSWSMLGGV